MCVYLDLSFQQKKVRMVEFGRGLLIDTKHEKGGMEPIWGVACQRKKIHLE